MSQPSLIMFDGPDGVGKTTQHELATKALRARGHDVYVTHMLGGSPMGEAIRQVIFSDIPRTALTNLHLCLAVYNALLETVQTKLVEGCIVLIDRSPLSLVAYQVYGDGLDTETGFAACDETMVAFKPSAVLIYSAEPELLQARRNARQEAADYFEKLPTDYHARTAEGYAAAAKRYASVVIDGSADVQTIHQQTMQIIDGILGDAVSTT